jgi:hypothetical protein
MTWVPQQNAEWSNFFILFSDGEPVVAGPEIYQAGNYQTPVGLGA